MTCLLAVIEISFFFSMRFFSIVLTYNNSFQVYGLRTNVSGRKTQSVFNYLHVDEPDFHSHRMLLKEFDTINGRVHNR